MSCFISNSRELKNKDTRDQSSKYEKNRSQVLTQKEYEFLKDLKLGNIGKYKASYQHTLKLRILKKQAAMIEACNLIKSLTDKLHSLK